MSTILIVILVLLLLGLIPGWHGLGPGPAGIIGLILLVVIILALAGHI